MKVIVKETRTLVLEVSITSRATREQVVEELKKRLQQLNHPLEPTSSIPRDGNFVLWRDGIVTNDGKLATCEVKEATPQERKIESVEGNL